MKNTIKDQKPLADYFQRKWRKGRIQKLVEKIKDYSRLYNRSMRMAEKYSDKITLTEKALDKLKRKQ